MQTLAPRWPFYLPAPILRVYLVSLYPHDTEAHMLYEVVDPAERRERGPVYPTLNEAIFAARSTDEVWQLADDAHRTRVQQSWPDPEFQPVAHADPQATERFVHEHIGRAEREATALLADHNYVASDQVHALVSAAWGKGFVAGFQRGTETYTEALDRLIGRDNR